MPIKVAGYAQNFHILKIFYATKSIALSYVVYRMLMPLPFDRGTMSSSLSPHCHHAGSFANPIKALSCELSASIPTYIKSIGRLLVSCELLQPMGSANKLMGSAPPCTSLCLEEWALFLDLDYSIIPHPVFFKFKSSYLEVYMLLDGLLFLSLTWRIWFFSSIFLKSDLFTY